MHEAAKTVRAIGLLCVRAPVSAFQTVWLDRLVSEIGYAAYPASMKNRKLPVFKNAVPEIARK
ncbi:hypothetical protein [Mesorhizobium sp. CA4]|uniref:hypothetical protein n=1 Tax=Mesorhizobium sp. CA4 TaxID=588499 RepID=UPI001CD14DF2|nr:hypothetical protein [Mesorhizobium sp. CA4]MBZ9820319.1 hypothetical protein [Mesorhizobium sp. CA4]